MMKRSIFYSFVLISVILFQSCAVNSKIGTTMPNRYYPNPSRSGKHHIIMEHMILWYDCVVDKKAGTTTFEGYIDLEEKKFRLEAEVDKINFKVYFLNENRIIIAEDYFLIPGGNKNIDKKIFFKKTFEYNPEFRYVAYGYYIRTLR